MARPCKSAKVLTDKSQTIAEINARIEGETVSKAAENYLLRLSGFRKDRKIRLI